MNKTAQDVLQNIGNRISELIQDNPEIATGGGLGLLGGGLYSLLSGKSLPGGILTTLLGGGLGAGAPAALKALSEATSRRTESSGRVQGDSENEEGDDVKDKSDLEAGTSALWDILKSPVEIAGMIKKNPEILDYLGGVGEEAPPQTAKELLQARKQTSVPSLWNFVDYLADPKIDVGPTPIADRARWEARQQHQDVETPPSWEMSVNLPAIDALGQAMESEGIPGWEPDLSGDTVQDMPEYWPGMP